MADDQAQQQDPTQAEGQPGTTLSLRDQNADTHYANTCVLTSTIEEVVMNFALNLQPIQRPGTVEMRINSRIIMTYPSAKRLAMTLMQVIQRFESANGVIQLDRAARPQAPAATGEPEAKE